MTADTDTDTGNPNDRVVAFVDGPETWAEAVVAATPEAVWQVLSDPGAPAAFSDELQSANWLDGADGPAVGARFEGHNGRGDTEWTTTSTVVECSPHERLSYLVEEDVATWTWTLEPADGGTRLRLHTKLGPGRSGITWAIKNNPDAEMEIIAGRLTALRQSMEATVVGIGALAAGA